MASGADADDLGLALEAADTSPVLTRVGSLSTPDLHRADARAADAGDGGGGGGGTRWTAVRENSERIVLMGRLQQLRGHQRTRSGSYRSLVTALNREVAASAAAASGGGTSSSSSSSAAAAATGTAAARPGPIAASASESELHAQRAVDDGGDKVTDLYALVQLLRFQRSSNAVNTSPSKKKAVAAARSSAAAGASRRQQRVSMPAQAAVSEETEEELLAELESRAAADASIDDEITVVEEADGAADAVAEAVAERSFWEDVAALPTDDVVWEDEDEAGADGGEDGTPAVHLASVTSLLLLLVNAVPGHRTTARFRSVFFLTLSMFTTPALLFAQLLECYDGAVEARGEAEGARIRADVVSVVDYYIEHHYQDFLDDPALMGLYESLVSRLPAGTDSRKQLENTYVRKQSASLRRRARGLSIGPADRYPPKIVSVFIPMVRQTKQMAVTLDTTYEDMVERLADKAGFSQRDRSLHVLAVELQGGLRVIPPGSMLYDFVQNDSKLQYKAAAVARESTILRFEAPHWSVSKTLWVEPETTARAMRGILCDKLLVSEDDVSDWALWLVSDEHGRRALGPDEVLLSVLLDNPGGRFVFQQAAGGPGASGGGGGGGGGADAASTAEFNRMAVKLPLAAVNVSHLCDALAFVASKKWQAIDTVELLNSYWNKADCDQRSPNVMAVITHFNAVSNWVVYSLLSTERLKGRAKVMKVLIKVADGLHARCDFNTLMAVLAGLNNSAVLRLKWTRAEVKKKHLERLDELEALMSSLGSYKAYRAELSACLEARRPCVPYCGVFLSDLTFVEEGNRTRVGGRVNWRKLALQHDIILDVKRLQAVAYPSKALNVNGKHYDYVKSFALLQCDEKEMYELSLRREPRGAAQSDIK